MDGGRRPQASVLAHPPGADGDRRLQPEDRRDAAGAPLHHHQRGLELQALLDPAVPISWDVAAIPAPRTKKTASIANLDLVVTPGCKVPEQAWALVAYTLRKEIQS